ncbi:hypothetical protein F5Y06DRAFT_266374 [Hypoxylon sp. FL0890]|nr:hypothetical protein F5Y06DRAFT_266374 [Hypoxylon sp. FL0890]
MDNLHCDVSESESDDFTLIEAEGDSSFYPELNGILCLKCVNRGDGKLCWRCWLKLHSRRDSKNPTTPSAGLASGHSWYQESLKLFAKEPQPDRLGLRQSQAWSLSSSEDGDSSDASYDSDDNNDDCDNDDDNNEEPPQYEERESRESEEQEKVESEECDAIQHDMPKEMLDSVFKEIHEERNITQHDELNIKPYYSQLGKYAKNSLCTWGKWFQQCVIPAINPEIDLDDPHCRAEILSCLIWQVTLQLAFNSLRQAALWEIDIALWQRNVPSNTEFTG